MIIELYVIISVSKLKYFYGSGKIENRCVSKNNFTIKTYNYG